MIVLRCLSEKHCDSVELARASLWDRESKEIARYRCSVCGKDILPGQSLTFYFGESMHVNPCYFEARFRSDAP